MTNLMPPSFRAAVAGFLSCPLLIFMNIPLIAASGPGLPPKRHSIMPHQSTPPRRDREVLVQFRPGIGPQERETVLANVGASRRKRLEGNSGVEQLELPAGRDVGSVVLSLLSDPRVEFAEPNFLIAKDDLYPDDARFNEQWALRNTGSDGGQFGSDIDAVSAWTTTTGSKATVIAVVDSGIDFTHPDLASNQWINPAPGPDGDVNGWDYVENGPEINDQLGHGTAVAGIIAAQGDNGLGTAGVMWQASLMSLRVLDNSGTGDISSAIEAIDYAVSHGAQVINLSWGTTGESTFLKRAIDRAYNRNVTVVCSAGNLGQSLDVNPYYPASFSSPNLISVAATDNVDQLVSWSNWSGSEVSVAAPGTNILTTKMGGGYWYVTGTSAAAPLVTGIAGLLKTFRPFTNARHLVNAITRGVRPVATLSGKIASGGVASATGAFARLPEVSNYIPPWAQPGRGSGGTGPGGNFSTTPPAATHNAPGVNLPDLQELRNAQPHQPRARAPIESNLMCADCDPQGGGAGGSYYPSGDPNFSTARRRLVNETGEDGVDLGSRNFNWSWPLLSLPGRAGLDLSLTITYNSLVWTKDGSYMKFNADLGSPAPGFRLGLPTLQQRFLNSQTGIYAYMMVMPSGRRLELQQIGSSNIYESQDGSYTQLDATNPNALLVRTTDGTQFTFTPVSINSEFRCTKIKDRNGNYISADYNTVNGHLLKITDTLGREIVFVYDSSSNLQVIRQTWNGGTHDWVTFNYSQVYVAPAFGGGLFVNGPNNNYTTVLSQVNLDDGSYFSFNYNNSFAQVNRINRYAGDGHLIQYTSYNVSSASGQTDCPRFTEKREWAENWNNHLEAVTSYSIAADGSWTQQITPDGTVYKEFFATAGWQSGLTTNTEVWSGGVKKKWTRTDWTQDNTALSYAKNARVTETNIWDSENNRRRMTINYGPYASYSLPYEVIEYAADGATIVRRRYTDYNLSSSYVDRRIIGLVSAIQVIDHATNSYVSKTTFDYDWGGEYLVATPQTATRHDSANYGSGFVTGRGNLSAAWRWDVTDINNPAKAIAGTRSAYNMTGSVVFSRDALGHQTSVSYTDAFSDQTNRNSFAYPTTITDAASFARTVQYNYDFGAVTRTQDPKGAIQIITYDAAARRERVTNQNTGAYTRWVYPSANTFIAAFSTIEAGKGEAFEGTAFDGAGRYRATQTDLPGSAGGFSTVVVGYDVMGRLSTRSNPTEMTPLWVPAGDDAGTGWLWTTQSYDWNGRPTITTLPDGSTRENTYGGCGCAGGAVTTVRDEQGRRRKLTMDVFGRLKQLDELDWNQNIYSTTTYAYNVLDQLNSINQAGQTRTFAYDGYSRLRTRTTPEQGTTTYSYFNDNTIQTITDARGAISTFSYNNRHLVTGISYNVSSAPGVEATPNVTFDYDSAGNRTSMNDGLGTMSYEYDSTSRLTSETRTFTGLGTFSLTYAYNLGNELISITNPWGVQVGYGYDKVGRPTSVSGANYAGVSSYINSVTYRAFGPKQVNYSNGHTLSMQYDNRLRLTQWSTPGVLRMQYGYTSERSGRVEFIRNQDDETLDRFYSYDHVGRLSAARSGNEARVAAGDQVPLLYNGPYSHIYQYDQFGNITYREGQGGDNPSFTATYTNNKRNGLTYDLAGNLTNDGLQSFTYDATGQAATASSTGYALQQNYDGNGLRGKRVENGTATYYLRSSVLDGQVVAEISSDTVWRRGYVYLGGQLIAVQYGGVLWMHQDPFAKSKRVTDGSGNVVSSIELDPWGGDTNRISNDVFQPRRFTTYQRDGNSSDEAMFRRYNRWWSRFDQPDPYDASYELTDPQSFNRYAYVRNDPVNLIDPRGLDPEQEWQDFNCRTRADIGVGVLDFAFGFQGPCAAGGPEVLPGADAGIPPGKGIDVIPLQQDYDPCNAIIAQFPASGQGYYTYGQANERYGRGEVVSSLVNFASVWNQNHPDTPIGIGDISLRNGGNIGGHREHEEGLQVDIRPMRNDGVNGPTNYHDRSYSFDLTNELFQGLSNLANVQRIRFNDPNVPGAVRDRNGVIHDNHLHVEFRASTPCTVRLRP